MSNDLWISADEIKNHMASLGSSGLSVTGKEKMMKDKVLLTSKYMLAQALQDFDKSNLQNIADNIKYYYITSSRFPNNTATIIYIPKNDGFFAVISNAGILLDFNFESKPKIKRKTLRSFTRDFMDFLIFDSSSRSLLKEREVEYDCNITVNILDPLNKLTNSDTFEIASYEIVRELFYHYSKLYELPYREMNTGYIYNIKKAKNTDFPLFNTLVNDEADIDDYLPSFYVLIREKTTIINNNSKPGHHIAIDMVKEWTEYANVNQEYNNYPISKRLNNKLLTYNLDISIKKYTGLPSSLSPKGDSQNDAIVTFYNINEMDRLCYTYNDLPSNNVFSEEDLAVLNGYQHYNIAKKCADDIIRNEAKRFKTDYEQYIKEFADFINIFKLGAENLANDLLDSHLTLRKDFEKKLEDIDHKLSTIDVI